MVCIWNGDAGWALLARRVASTNNARRFSLLDGPAEVQMCYSEETLGKAVIVPAKNLIISLQFINKLNTADVKCLCLAIIRLEVTI